MTCSWFSIIIRLRLIKRIQIDASKSHSDSLSESTSHYEVSPNYLDFLTVKSVGPETNEQHSSFRASAEHISHSRSDLSENYFGEKKFPKNSKTCENIYLRLNSIYLHNFWPNTIDICCILLANSSFWISHWIFFFKWKISLRFDANIIK